MLLAVGHGRWKMAQIERRIATVSAHSLREAGSYLMLNRVALLNASRGHEPERMQCIDAVVLMRESALYEEACPNVIKQLKPRFVDIYSNQVFIYLSGAPRLGIWVFGEGVPVEEASMPGIMRELGDRVWLQGGW